MKKSLKYRKIHKTSLVIREMQIKKTVISCLTYQIAANLKGKVREKQNPLAGLGALLTMLGDGGGHSGRYHRGLKLLMTCF